jgi:hypothetical protein
MRLGPTEVNNHLQSGWLEFSCSGNCRWQEKTEALLCFDVELAVAPGWGKNQEPICTGGHLHNLYQ